MDTVGIEVPNVQKRVDRRLAAAAVAATAIAALGGGYALGNSSDAAAPAPTLIARGMPATWDDAVRESNAMKRHARAIEQAGAIDVRMARVEK
jgi:hypothetical protein